MSRLTRRVRSDVSPMILKLMNLEEVPTECIEVIGTDSKTCDEVCRENQCGSCVLSAVFEKLAHYEDLEDDGKLVEVIRCKDCIRYGDEYVVGAGWCDEHEHLTNDDDYCSYAVAKLAEVEGAE